MGPSNLWSKEKSNKKKIYIVMETCELEQTLNLTITYISDTFMQVLKWLDRKYRVKVVVETISDGGWEWEVEKILSQQDTIFTNKNPIFICLMCKACFLS